MSVDQLTRRDHDGYDPSARHIADRSPLRSPAAFTAPVALVVSLFYLSETLASSVPVPYALAQASAANTSMFVIGPYAAACAAWEMQLLRRLWGRWSVHRAWPFVIAMRLRLVVAAALAITGVNYAVALLPDLAGGSPGWQMPTLSLLGVCAWTLFGAAVGLALGPILALTASVLVPFLWMVLPGGWSILWVRHLTGVLFDCCSVNSVVDMRAWAASALTLGLVAVASLSVIGVRLSPPQLRLQTGGFLIAIVVALGALMVPVSVADKLGADPSTPRAVAGLRCQSDVCVWPETADKLAVNIKARERVLGAWDSFDLPPVTQRFGPVIGPDMLNLVALYDGVDPATASMAQALPRAVLGCRDDYSDSMQNERIDDLAVTLLQALGLDPAQAGIVSARGVPPAAMAQTFAETPRCRA